MNYTEIKGKWNYNAPSQHLVSKSYVNIENPICMSYKAYLWLENWLNQTLFFLSKQKMLHDQALPIIYDKNMRFILGQWIEKFESTTTSKALVFLWASSKMCMSVRGIKMKPLN